MFQHNVDERQLSSGIPKFSSSPKRSFNITIDEDEVRPSFDLLQMSKSDIINSLRVTLTCSSCNSDFIHHDFERGEITCLKCGRVIDDHFVDARGVRVYDQSDVESKVHYEPLKPTNRPILKLDKNDPDSRRRERQNNRVEWNDKKIMIMGIEIRKIKNTLPISKRVEDRAMEEVRKVFKTDILRGRNAMAMGLSLLYYACIKCNAPVGLKDILAAVSPINDYSAQKKYRKSVRSAIHILSKEMGYKFVPKDDYADLLNMISSNLKIPQHVTTHAIKLLRGYKETNSLSGDPKGYAGACLYYACKTSGVVECKRITQKQVASEIEMTEVTIRKRMKDMHGFLDA